MTHGSDYLALGLTGGQVVELIDDDDLIARLDSLPIAFSVLGLDRIDGGSLASITIDASVSAAHLASRTRAARFLVAATLERDHPFNLARRVASLAHLSRGRSGLILGEGPTVSEAARAIRALEQSWPFDSVVADRDSRTFVQADRIRRVDLVGTYRIAGPLTVPAPSTGPSVLARYDRDRRTPGPDFDLVLGPLTGQRVVSDAVAPVNSLLSEAEWLLAKGYANEAGPATLRDVLALPEAVDTWLGEPAFGVTLAPASGDRR